ncbi:MAG: phosphatidate cytidylyltransferase [Oscillospiraceae bacterium]|nr:phosphatidate cytidylyltransferase [Oscillospiraceae bacterium]
MKQRLISAVIGLAVLAAVMVFYTTAVFNLAVMAIGCLAVYEILLATKYVENKALAVICLLFSAAIPFLSHEKWEVLVPVICCTFVFSLFVLLLAEHKRLRIEQMGLAFFISLVVPFAFSTFILIRDGAENVFVGAFYVLFGLGSAWFSDSGAFFSGKAFGRHKLAPEISPKKTVEGAVGGVVSNLIFLVLFFWLYRWGVAHFAGVTLVASYPRLLVLATLGSVMGMLGDLSFSLIKRQCSIKDFGTIMPGHGGVLDRFDSVLFTMPTTYLFILFFPFVSVL